MAIEQRLFDNVNGQDVYEYTLSRGNLSVCILNYGGIVRSFNVKTASGVYDIVLGYDTLSEYQSRRNYFGCLVGRVANRIGDGKFTLNGKEYILCQNEGTGCLHGGKEGFNRKIWKASVIGDYALRLEYLSKDGEENFPGNLNVSVIYSLTESNGLKIEYFAEADKDTPVSLTNHSYFNLNGEGNGEILGHVMQIFADKITPVDAEMIPTGELRAVKGTPFDFTEPKPIGRDIDKDDEQIKICKGYDVNFVKTEKGYSLLADVSGDKSGIKMRVFTSEDGVQLYTANFSNPHKGKKGEYLGRAAFCLETQAFPNAINRKQFPSVVLKTGEKYRSVTEYVIEV